MTIEGRTMMNIRDIFASSALATMVLALPAYAVDLETRKRWLRHARPKPNRKAGR
jgi:hypothetical protein